VTSYLFTSLSKFAVISQFVVTDSAHSIPQFSNVQPLNVYVYCSPLVAGVAITVVNQIVNSFSFVEIGVQ
jgi:hypothetical protein